MTLLAVFTASVLGSLHCASMCGGFAAAIPVAGSQAGVAGQRWALVAYHGTRGLGYAVLGTVAGTVGAGLEGAGQGLGVQRAAGMLTGVVLMLLAVSMLWRERVRKAPSLIPVRVGPRGDRVRVLFTALLRRGGLWAAAGLGLASALLPCAWLWSYVLVAAGTGSTKGGLAVMVVFWLGTLPILLSLGTLAAWLRTHCGRWAPRWSALVLLALGTLALLGKLPGPGTTDAPMPPCHQASP